MTLKGPPTTLVRGAAAASTNATANRAAAACNGRRRLRRFSSTAASMERRLARRACTHWGWSAKVEAKRLSPIERVAIASISCPAQLSFWNATFERPAPRVPTTAMLEKTHLAKSSTRQNSPPGTWFSDLDDAARLLALIPKAIPIEAAHWFHYDDPDIALLCQFGLARQGPELRPTMAGAPVEVAAAGVDGIFAGYQKLRASDKGRVNLALERVIRSRCQFVSGNRAIDLAIALEVLFMNVDRDEHSYKISLRAARLLRKDLQARRRTFLEVKRLYDMRSSMVHSGSVKNEYLLDWARVSAHEIVEAVDVICTEAIRAFLGKREIPDDWRNIELAGDGT
jgi:hypothetical protein